MPSSSGSTLGHGDRPLCATYDLAMLDLDGVVYIGPAAVPGVPALLGEASAAGMHLAYVTNNASRPPERVAAHLNRLGVPAAPEDVVTSAQAAARLLLQRVGAGAAVFVIGGEGLFAALEEQALRGMQAFDGQPQAVVSGYHPEVTWRTVSDGALLVRRGLPWVATNTDLTVPTPHGAGPGNGVLVKAVGEYAGRSPVVAGKPEPPLFQETQRRVGGQRPLVVGDRLDTDIEGARRAGYDSLLVMTGVTGLPELVAAPPERRPTYVSATLQGLLDRHEQPTVADGRVRSGGWSASTASGTLEVTGDGTVDDWWRVVAVAAWRHLDSTGRVVEVGGQPLQVPWGVEPPEEYDRHAREESHRDEHRT